MWDMALTFCPAGCRCGHCKSLAPAFVKVAESLHGIVNVAAVDCDAEANKPLCSQYEIKGFPTIKAFSAGKGKKRASDYQGQHSRLHSPRATEIAVSPHVRATGMTYMTGMTGCVMCRAKDSEGHC